ncbi:ABC transporter permease [Paenibacillus sp. 19GGS1-52]|uniref:ABC transporter permease n=1 Tax=Paenibacillus sp. 19GGS1-52 TaxID=2758563 RepID=UPI001EFB2EA9|nr:ABC transporter permease [Paenibacillus sp. 19GGS1-52]ULO05922.1 ABC transporter permease [Paenibacillus sp. 19GGS1-52]
MKYILRTICASFIIHMKQSFSRPTFRFVIILQPLFYSLLLYFMYNRSELSDIGERIIIGTGIMNLWSSMIYSSASDIERERYMGTLETIYTVPSDFRIIYLGKVLGNIALGLFSVVISIVCVTGLLGFRVTIGQPLLFISSAIVTILSFIIISLLLALLFTLSRNSRVFMNCLEYPVFILCGVVFPVTLLPKGLQWFSYILSPTWSTDLLKESMSGNLSYPDFIWKLSVFSLLNVIYLALMVLFYKNFNSLIREKGTLGVH